MNFWLGFHRSTSTLAINPPPPSFVKCNIRPSLINSLTINFNISHPTLPQFNFLSLLNRSSTRDIILHLPTGQGKSLILVLGLLNLNKPHTNLPPPASVNPNAITPAHLIIVPHYDLGSQLYHWISRLVPSELVSKAVHLASPNSQSNETCTNPHILIGTPSVLLDMTLAHRLNPNSIGTIALDEVDSMSPPIPKFNIKKATARHKHIKPVESLMASLISTRSGDANNVLRPLTQNPHLLANKSQEVPISPEQFETWFNYKPRVIAISATASASVRHHLVNHLKWIRPNRYAHLVSTTEDVSFSANPMPDSNSENKFDIAREGGETVAPLEHNPAIINIRHSAIIVTPTYPLCLLSYYQSEKSKPPGPLDHLGTTDRSQSKSFLLTLGVPTLSNMISTMVAYACVRSINHALVVVLKNQSVTNTVQLLNTHVSVNASFWTSETDPHPIETDPIRRFQVISSHAIRGLDIHGLNHVFILGAPDRASVYQHIAGRIGRLGHTSNQKSGSVVCFCDADDSQQLNVIWNWLSAPDSTSQLQLVPVSDSDLVQIRHNVNP